MLVFFGSILEFSIFIFIYFHFCFRFEKLFDIFFFLFSGFGENIDTAVKTASLDALQTLFGIHDNMKPFNFKIQVESQKQQIKQ